MLYPANGTGAEEAAGSSGWGKVLFKWDTLRVLPLLVLCAVVWWSGRSRRCLPVQYLQPFPWLISDWHSSVKVVPEPWGWCRTDVTACHLWAGSPRGEGWQRGTAEWTELKGEQCFLWLNVAVPALSGDLLVGTFHGRSPEEPTVKSYLRSSSLVVKRFVLNL